MSASHFDDQATTWDQDESKIVRAREIADAVASAIPLRGDERLLEYGAGTGLVSQFLAPRIGELTLADPSEGMRTVMAEKIAAGVLPDAPIWSLDLASAPTPQERFDLIVTSLALHHVPEVPPVLRGFYDILDVGGAVFIADLELDADGSFHAHVEDFDGHHGFDRDALARDLAEAGFAEIEFHDCTSVTKGGRDYGVFLAVARRV